MKTLMISNFLILFLSAPSLLHASQEAFIGFSKSNNSMAPRCLVEKHNYFIESDKVWAYPTEIEKTFKVIECRHNFGTDLYSFQSFEGNLNGKPCKVIHAKNQSSGFESLFLTGEMTTRKVESDISRSLFFKNVENVHEHTSVQNLDYYLEVPLINMTQPSSQAIWDCGPLPCTTVEFSAQSQVSKNLLRASGRFEMINSKKTRSSEKDEKSWDAQLDLALGQVNAKSSQTRYSHPLYVGGQRFSYVRKEISNDFYCKDLKAERSWMSRFNLRSKNFLIHQFNNQSGELIEIGFPEPFDKK